jgi:hypothetical protein
MNWLPTLCFETYSSPVAMISGRLRCSALAAASALLVGPAAAAPTELVRVEFSARHAQRSPHEARQFETLVKRGVQRLALERVRDDRDDEAYVLSAALLKLRTHSRQDRVTSSCSVSLALRDQRSGIMRAVMRGNAHATDARRHASGTRATAMRVAVRTALSRLPSVLD